MSDNHTNTNANDNFFVNCYAMFKDEIQDIELTPANVSKVLSKAMKVVEITEMKGEQQKYLAKEMVSKAVSELPESEQKTVLLTVLDNNILEDIVETIVLATKGELPINQVIEQVKSRCCYLF